MLDSIYHLTLNEFEAKFIRIKTLICDVVMGIIMWASTRENLSSGVRERHRPKPACAYVIHFLESIRC